MNLEVSLRELEEAGLIQPVHEPETVCMFNHTLTQARAYESLLLKTRRDLHARIASAYEELYPDRLDEFAPLLARHYAETGNAGRTLAYATRAGDAAARVYATAEAVANYTLALQAGEQAGVATDQLIRLYRQRGRALESSGRYAEALATYKDMQVHGSARGDRALVGAALIARATLYSMAAEFRDIGLAQALCDQALALAQEEGDPSSEASVLWNLMVLNTYGYHDPWQAVRHGERALEISRSSDSPASREQIAFISNDLGYAYFQTGQLARALDSFEQARTTWSQLDNKPMWADNLAAAALVELLRGEMERADTLAQVASAMTQSVGNPWGISNTGLMQGLIFEKMGEYAQALDAIQIAVRAADEAGAAAPGLAARIEHGWLHGILGAVEQGIELEHAALAYADAHYREWRLWAEAVLARLYIRAGRLSEAEAVLKEEWPADLARHLGLVLPPGAIMILLAMCELAIAQRAWHRALSRLDRLQEHLDRIECTLYIPEVLYLKSQVHCARGERNQARELLEGALSQARSLGALGIVPEILGALGELAATDGNHAEAKAMLAQVQETHERLRAGLAPELQKVPAVGRERLDCHNR